MSRVVAFAMLLWAGGCATSELASHDGDSGRPNVLIVFTDDQGWADLGTQGAQGFETPHLDALAAEGQRFTHFRVPIAVCTPSRAALLTGRQPSRMGLAHRVVFPYSEHGLPASEVTLAGQLKRAGYRTGIVGKWHLGHASDEFHPLNHGFDHWFGVPYSNDMDGHYYRHNEFQSPPLPLWRDRQVVEHGPEQRYLTKRFTDAAVDFVSQESEQPWFLYLAHVMPHQPLSVSWEFAGKSPAGLYGDVINEIDASVGRVLAAVEQRGMADNTIVIFTSDNGPWRQASAGPLRGRKNSTWEGGHRVPCLVRWPARLAPREVRHGAWSTLDLLPTLATLCGAPVDAELVLDGYDRSAWLLGQASHTARPFAYVKNDRLHAVEFDGWKLHIYRPEEEGARLPLLYELQRDGAAVDTGETRDLSLSRPDKVVQLEQVAERFQDQLALRD